MLGLHCGNGDSSLNHCFLVDLDCFELSEGDALHFEQVGLAFQYFCHSEHLYFDLTDIAELLLLAVCLSLGYKVV